MRYLNDKQRENIGFNYVIENIDTVSKLGNDTKRKVVPFTKNKEAELLNELENTERVIRLLDEKPDVFSEIGDNLCRVKDVIPSIKKLGTGMILDEIELFEIKVFAKICNNMIRCIKEIDTPIKGVEFLPVAKVYEILDPEQTGFDTFYIYDNYSDKLKDLRSKRRTLESKIGSVKDLELRNQLLLERSEILNQEAVEEYTIKKTLTQKLEKYAAALLSNANVIGYFDFLIAKAKYFVATKAVRPIISLDFEPIELEQVYNPYYAKIMAEKKTVMQKLDLRIQSGVTVLTGANMGGKSISMKTLALNVMLANCGMYVYAQAAKLPVVDFLYMISDDLQSIDYGLSTFGAEVIQLKKVIGASGKKDGLIILDELARGTNPTEARTIVNAIINLLKKRKSYTFISTHFDEIEAEDVIHLQVVGINRLDFNKLLNSVKINNKEALKILQTNMDYSIEQIEESHVPKNALQIAELLGLKELDFGRANKKE